VTLSNRFDPADRAFNLDQPGEDRAGDPVCTAEEYRRMRSNPHDFVGAFEADSRCFAGTKASTWVGLHPQLVAYDPLGSSGYNVGFNPVQTAAAPGTGFGPTETRYYWYAGKVDWDEGGRAVWTPIEFGTANLLPADPIHQHPKGLFGALVIEPEGSSWREDPNTRVSATVTSADGTSFREFVMIVQDDLQLYWLNPKSDDPFEPVPIVSAEAEAAVNYSTAFLLFRLAPPAPWSVAIDPKGQLTIFDQTRVDQTRIQTDAFLGGDPPTPVWTAHAGTPVRFRVGHPGGIFEAHVFTLHGHGWPEYPYRHQSNPANPDGDPYRAIAQVIGDNRLSEWKGQQIGVGPHGHFDFVIEPSEEVDNGAGGPQRVPGDYLYRSFPAVFFEGGFWGIFRVGPEVPEGEERDVIAITSATRLDDGSVALTGSNGPILGTGRFAEAVTVHAGGAGPDGCEGPAVAGRFEFTETAGPMRRWRWTGPLTAGPACVRSSGGGFARTEVPPAGAAAYSASAASPPATR